MGIKFSNNAQGTLIAGIGSGDTTNMELTAGDGLLFPTVVWDEDDPGVDYFYSTLVSVAGVREIVKVTEHQEGTDVFQRFVRAQDDTVAAAFAIGDKIQLRFPKIVLEAFRDDIAINAAAIAVNLAHNTASEQLLYAPSGLVFYIYNPVAEVPTGWSLHAGPADCLLAIAGGASSYNTPGETMAGTWTRTGHVHGQAAHTHTGPSHTHTGPSHTHTTPDHTLTSNEMPAHTHTEQYCTVHGANSGNQGLVTGKGVNDARTTVDTGSTGGGAAHNHGATGASGTAATGASGTAATSSNGDENTTNSKDPITDRPYAAVGFLIERD